jgi:hypothetical protein
MRRPFLVVLLVVAAVFAAAVGFLASWDIPPPTARIEKTIPNDRLGR